MRTKKNKNYIEYEQKIIDAFVRLFKKNEGKHITVAQIIEEANVTRPTFYLHFKSIDDIYKALESRLINEDLDFFISNPNKFIDHLLEAQFEFAKLVKENVDMFTCLAKSTHFGEFVYHLTTKACAALANTHYLKGLKDKHSADKESYIWLTTYSIITTQFDVYIAKLRGDVKASFDFLAYWMADYVYKMCSSVWRKSGLLKQEHNYMEEYRAKYNK